GLRAGASAVVLTEHRKILSSPVKARALACPSYDLVDSFAVDAVADDDVSVSIAPVLAGLVLPVSDALVLAQDPAHICPPCVPQRAHVQTCDGNKADARALNSCASYMQGHAEITHPVAFLIPV